MSCVKVFPHQQRQTGSIRIVDDELVSEHSDPYSLIKFIDHNADRCGLPLLDLSKLCTKNSEAGSYSRFWFHFCACVLGINNVSKKYSVEAL